MSPTIDSDAEVEELPDGIAAKARALLWSLIRPRVWAVIGLLALVLTNAFASVLGPIFVARAIDVGLPSAAAGDMAPLWTEIGLFIASAVVTGVATFSSTRGIGVVSQKMLLDLRHRLFVHVQKLDLGYHEKSTSGRLVARQTNDMQSFQEFVSYGLLETLLGLIMMASIAVILLVMNVPLALVVFAGFIPLFFVTRNAQRSQRTAYRRTRTSIAKVIVHFTETMGGIRAVQAFRRQPAGRAKLDTEDSEYADANTVALRGVAWFAGSSRLIGNITQVAVILVGAWLVISGHTQVGVLAAFVLYLRRFYAPLDELVQSFNLYQSASAALEKIAAVLDVEPQVREPEAPRDLPTRATEPLANREGRTSATGEGQATVGGQPAGTSTTTNAQQAGTRATGREIEIDGVRFAYSADGPDILPRMDLRIEAGQTVALVGATGAGKSTLVKLVTRFYDATEGALRIDGVDVRDLTDVQLRGSVVMVTQESYLFGGTIADNIRVGRPDATDAEVVAAARAVGLSDYVERLPHGYDTDVKKRGGRLSSGQRQLVSFARAFIADPDVIVLDEATAHLDIPSERLVQRALETVLRGRTAIIIAHRLSTVEIADRVLVMDAGRVVEDGTPAKLIAGTGRFAKLHSAWRDSLAS